MGQYVNQFLSLGLCLFLSFLLLYSILRYIKRAEMLFNYDAPILFSFEQHY